MYAIIDTHCDTAEKLFDKGETLSENTCMLSIPFMDNYRSYIQFFAAWVGKDEKDPNKRAKDILAKAKSEIENNNLKLILKAKDLEETQRHGGVLALEDARSLAGDINNLYEFYDFGVRAITLAWNDDNEVTTGANTKSDTGLTEFGKRVVAEMNCLKMIVDVSHTSEKGFWDVMEVSSVPVMASHSNCYSRCRHRRNLKDDQIKALIKTGGIMGINIAPEFLEENGEADVKSIIRHIDHAVSLGAEDNLCLGSDFDGIEKTPVDIENAADYQKLIEEMLKSGYDEAFIDKITHKNFINFIKKVK